MCMYVYIVCNTRGAEGMLPQNIFQCSEVVSEAEQILDAVLCKPCRAIVATWFAEYCI